ncbi:MAG: AmiS/UreI family transporter [Pseudonocardiaceae bacterium]
MGLVGLIYVGAVLFINGVMLLGLVDQKSAAVFNLFVGTLQVITPTYLIFTAGGDANTILNASGIYLFGFTYLYVGITLLAKLDSTGVGYFSLFVAVMALGYSAANFIRAGTSDLFTNVFGVIWLYWAFLWALFFVLLGLKKEAVTIYTGWVAAIQGWVTGAIPAFLLLTNWWRNPDLIALLLAIGGVVVFAALIPLTRPRDPQHRVPSARAATDVAATA